MDILPMVAPATLFGVMGISLWRDDRRTAVILAGVSAAIIMLGILILLFR
jgi:hypothetical protein